MTPRWQACTGWMKAAALAVPMLGLGMGCKEKLVEGSLGELLDMDYQTVSVLITDDETSVSFYQPQGKGQNTVLAVSAKISDLQVVAHGKLDLTEQILTGGQRGAVTRNVLNDPHRTFPTLAVGELEYDEVPKVGGTVTGKFNLTFAECTDFACGRTAFANFTAEVPKP